MLMMNVASAMTMVMISGFIRRLYQRGCGKTTPKFQVVGRPVGGETVRRRAVHIMLVSHGLAVYTIQEWSSRIQTSTAACGQVTVRRHRAGNRAHSIFHTERRENADWIICLCRKKLNARFKKSFACWKRNCGQRFRRS